jgi:hypothetical protein
VDPSRAAARETLMSSVDPMQHLGAPGRTAKASGSDPPPASQERPNRVAGLTRAELRWAGVVVLAVVLAAAIAVWVLHDSSDDVGTRSAHDANQRAVAGSSERIFKLVTSLLASPDWSDAHIAEVNAGLLEEGSRHIAAEQHTEWFQRFAAEVRRRLKKEQHRSRGNHLAPEKSSLAALAVTIGLDPRALDEPLSSPLRGDSHY